MKGLRITTRIDEIDENGQTTNEGSPITTTVPSEDKASLKQGFETHVDEIVKASDELQSK